jgi:predicted CXXCH cytochrome family protein
MSRSLTLAAMLLACLLPPRDLHAQVSMDAATVAFQEDTHAAAGLSCVACHATGADGVAVYEAPPRTEIAALCATCHSDAVYMRRFDPQVPVDQFLQYQTSTHGQQMAVGNEGVATCTDCHGAHGVQPTTDPRSLVAPLNVTTTCGRCHGDATHMEPFGMPTSPPDDWSASVHAVSLLQRGDMSAPTCVSCHGSHGATPPGVESVANVCAQCHLREAELFRSSPKQVIFDVMGQAECLVCHDNHRVEPPADAWVGLEDGAVCALCHDESTGGAQTIRDMRQGLDRLSADLSAADAILTRAERAGMLVETGRAAWLEAREHQVHSRVLVHAFAAAPFAEMAAAGSESAQIAYDAGEAALQELRVRRGGLAIATLLVLAFLVTLGLKIRRLPGNFW